MMQKITRLSGKLAFALALSIFTSQAMAVGAIAIDGNQGSQYGFSYDYPSAGEAEQHALNECGSGCQVVLTFESGCGAYAADQAAGSTVYGWGTADSKSAVQSRALSECAAHGGSDCVVRVWGCNSQ